MAVVTIAEPRPVVTLTEMPPMRLHTEMYHIMFLSPYLRALSLARDRAHGESALRAPIEHNAQCDGDEDADVREEAGREEELLEVQDLADRLLRGRCGGVSVGQPSSFLALADR
jgi:hypothetical protein